MPPVPTPTNAPTTGLPALFYWGLVAFAAVLWALHYFFPSGKERLQYRGRNESNAIAILQAQIRTNEEGSKERLRSMAADVRGLKLEVRRLVKNEEGNKEYRHALANQAQLATAQCEVLESLLLECADQPGIPEHLVRRIRGMKTIKELLSGIPLPPVRHYTIKEIEAEEDEAERLAQEGPS
ncbi:hypothetical protein IAD21_00906 [Abditibacteriota bacterium]|nr:hypothetical protein IAD21_00906 [Abditibacteriota bacterium]